VDVTEIEKTTLPIEGVVVASASWGRLGLCFWRLLLGLVPKQPTEVAAEASGLLLKEGLEGGAASHTGGDHSGGRPGRFFEVDPVRVAVVGTRVGSPGAALPPRLITDPTAALLTSHHVGGFRAWLEFEVDAVEAWMGEV